MEMPLKKGIPIHWSRWGGGSGAESGVPGVGGEVAQEWRVVYLE